MILGEGMKFYKNMLELFKPRKEELWLQLDIPYTPKLLDKLSHLKYIKEFDLPYPIISDPLDIAIQFIGALEREKPPEHIYIT
jgi:hypothetical protein